MSDYQPISLTSLCNVGTSFVGSGTEPSIGNQTFYGLPFVIGAAEPDPACCFVGFAGEGGTDASVTVPIGTTAHNLILAHALLESKVYDDGEPIGHLVAQYVVCFADGTEVRLPIRERFEINIVPAQWGHFSFLSRPDQIAALMPRHEGQWRTMGARQSEVIPSWPHSYFLWAWKNPYPDRVIEVLRIEPSDRKFLLAAVTLGHLDEPPFYRTARREVRITLPQPEDAARPLHQERAPDEEAPMTLEVEVDRGVATYAFALPARSVDEFLNDPMQGWGEPLNEQASPAYVEIAATPSATLNVKNDGETLASVGWADLEARGRIETPRAHLEIVDRGRNWVQVTVLDDATGEPIPCRVHFRSPEGIPYQPHGHHNHVNSNLGSWHMDVGGDLRLGQITYAYIDCRCQGWLPRSEVLGDVARGFEYEPLRTAVRIEPGQRELTLRLKRWTDLNAQRWFSGDSHVHFLGSQGAHREAQGEGLNVVNLLQSQWGHLFTNTEDWIGAPSVSDNGKTIVYCSQENRQHMLGHLTLWGLKQPIMPWCTDGPMEAELGGALEETLSHWADAAHAQGGTVIIPHLPTPNGEPAALIATGRADAVEMLRQAPYEHMEYYRYLNCGYRLPLVGGTDKMSSEVPVGLYRTYAYVPDDEEFNYDAWCRAVRAGRTFLSGGPIIRFSVDGARIGDTLRLPRGGGTLEVEATAESIFPIHTLEIVQQGQVVAATAEAQGARRLDLKATLKVDGHTWLAARCGGPNYQPVTHHDGWHRGIFAHTSPIYIAVEDDWWLFDREAAQYMLTLVEGSLSHIRHQALHYPPGSVTHHHGEPDHMEYLERPFHEAAAAIHARMHQLRIPH